MAKRTKKSSRKSNKSTKKTKKKSSEKVPGKSVGKQSGVGVTATWNVHLKANVKKKLTDEKLLAVMQREFPDRDHFQPVSRVRSFFNTGRYGFGHGDGVELEKGDERRSYPYDNKGEIVKRGFAAQKSKKGKAKAKSTSGKKDTAKKRTVKVRRRKKTS